MIGERKWQAEVAKNEMLENRVQELEEWQRQMIEKAATKSLDGYRELGQRVADAENERDNLKQHIRELKSLIKDAQGIFYQQMLDEGYEEWMRQSEKVLEQNDES